MQSSRRALSWVITELNAAPHVERQIRPKETNSCLAHIVGGRELPAAGDLANDANYRNGRVKGLGVAELSGNATVNEARGTTFRPSPQKSYQ